MPELHPILRIGDTVISVHPNYVVDVLLFLAAAFLVKIARG